MQKHMIVRKAFLGSALLVLLAVACGDWQPTQESLTKGAYSGCTTTVCGLGKHACTEAEKTAAGFDGCHTNGRSRTMCCYND